MKVEIPESVKEVLRCGDCNELLSCGPVFLVHDTSEAVCGRCSQPPEEETHIIKSEIRNQSRNIHYEAAAKLLSFPCRYSHQGCLEKLDFSEDTPNIHERICEFRNFFCPIVSRDSCSWVGSRLELGDHCRDVHPTHFFQNPFVLPRPDLFKSSLSNFLVSAFRFLFLVHVKVCATSGKLFHSVSMFGDSKLLERFSYSLKIKGNGSKVTKEGSVLRTEKLVLEEPTANYVSTNSLLGILDGNYNDSEFIITIQVLFRYCKSCFKNIEDVSDSEFCDECQGNLIKCEFNAKGCLFVDVNEKKCKKHEHLFCVHKTKCWCEVNLVGGSLIEHLGSSTSCRKTTKANIHSVVRVIRNTSENYDYLLLSSINIGTVICSYNLSDSNFHLRLCTSLPSFELKNFKCSIEVTDSQTKHSRIFTPQIEYNKKLDWFINEKMDDFPSWQNNGIDVKINIEKI